MLGEGIVQNISNNFIRVAVVFALVGMGLGIQMAVTDNRDQIQSHAHVNLIGWVTMMLYGLYYRAHEAKAAGKLPVAHFWLSTLGAIVINVGIYLTHGGMEGAHPIAGVGAILVILGMISFATVVFRNGGEGRQ